jgi:hypothetical protein
MIPRRPAFCVQRKERLKLILAGYQFLGKHAFKPALLVLVMQQKNRSDPQRMPARTAGRHFSMQVLQETIGEMILVGSASCGLYSMLTAIWTGIFKSILLRIAAQRRPARVTNPNSLFRRRKTHDDVPPKLWKLHM